MFILTEILHFWAQCWWFYALSTPLLRCEFVMVGREYNLGLIITDIQWLTEQGAKQASFINPQDKLNIITVCLTLFYKLHNSPRPLGDLIRWSNFAFSILLSLARLFWNQILTWVSVRRRSRASSQRRVLVTYSTRRYSDSRFRVWSALNVVRWRRAMWCWCCVTWLWWRWW